MLYDMLNERLQTIWINNGHPQITNVQLVVLRNTVVGKSVTEVRHCLLLLLRLFGLLRQGEQGGGR